MRSSQCLHCLLPGIASGGGHRCWKLPRTLPQVRRTRFASQYLGTEKPAHGVPGIAVREHLVLGSSALPQDGSYFEVTAIVRANDASPVGTANVTQLLAGMGRSFDDFGACLDLARAVRRSAVTLAPAPASGARSRDHGGPTRPSLFTSSGGRAHEPTVRAQGRPAAAAARRGAPRLFPLGGQRDARRPRRRALFPARAHLRPLHQLCVLQGKACS